MKPTPGIHAQIGKPKKAWHFDSLTKKRKSHPKYIAEQERIRQIVEAAKEEK